MLKLRKYATVCYTTYQASTGLLVGFKKSQTVMCVFECECRCLSVPACACVCVGANMCLCVMGYDVGVRWPICVCLMCERAWVRARDMCVGAWVYMCVYVCWYMCIADIFL